METPTQRVSSPKSAPALQVSPNETPTEDNVSGNEVREVIFNKVKGIKKVYQKWFGTATLESLSIEPEILPTYMPTEDIRQDTPANGKKKIRKISTRSLLFTGFVILLIASLILFISYAYYTNGGFAGRSLLRGGRGRGRGPGRGRGRGRGRGGGGRGGRARVHRPIPAGAKRIMKGMGMNVGGRKSNRKKGWGTRNKTNRVSKKKSWGWGWGTRNKTNRVSTTNRTSRTNAMSYGQYNRTRKQRQKQQRKNNRQQRKKNRQLRKKNRVQRQKRPQQPYRPKRHHFSGGGGSGGGGGDGGFAIGSGEYGYAGYVAGENVADYTEGNVPGDYTAGNVAGGYTGGAAPNYGGAQTLTFQGVTGRVYRGNVDPQNTSSSPSTFTGPFTLQRNPPNHMVTINMQNYGSGFYKERFSASTLHFQENGQFCTIQNVVGAGGNVITLEIDVSGNEGRKFVNALKQSKRLAGY